MFVSLISYCQNSCWFVSHILSDNLLSSTLPSPCHVKMSRYLGNILSCVDGQFSSQLWTVFLLSTLLCYSQFIFPFSNACALLSTSFATSCFHCVHQAMIHQQHQYVQIDVQHCLQLRRKSTSGMKSMWSMCNTVSKKVSWWNVVGHNWLFVELPICCRIWIAMKCCQIIIIFIFLTHHHV